MTQKTLVTPYPAGALFPDWLAMFSIAPHLAVLTAVGYLSPWSPSHTLKARPICLMLLTHFIRFAASLALSNAGNSRPARMAMMAITTRSSMRVKAFDGFAMIFFIGCIGLCVRLHR